MVNQQSNELFELVLLDIPEEPKVEDGFLEIIGMSHHENINSRIYAYYLDSRKNAQLSEVFLRALLQLIERKGGRKLAFGDYEVRLEERTDNGNRIDVVIDDPNEQVALIIENKIYHHLANDLIDYWKHFDYPSSQKQGVLLTLEETRIEEETKELFINLTHLDLVKEIRSIGLPAGLPMKIYQYLNDFFQTIENLTKDETMNESVRFFLEHSVKINKAIEAKSEATRFLKQEIQKVANHLEWSIYGNSTVWQNIYDKKGHPNTYYTIVWEDLFNGGKQISIIIELWDDDKKKVNKLDEHLKGHPKFEALKKKTSQGGNWIHYLSKDYQITLSEIEALHEFILNKIDTDFKEVMDQIMSITSKK